MTEAKEAEEVVEEEVAQAVEAITEAKEVEEVVKEANVMAHIIE